MNLEIDGGRLASELEALASITDAEPPAVTRIVFTPADLRARAFVIDNCKAAGLKVCHDAIGNTFARWPGSEEQAPAVATGSHIDAIPNAGRYDGVVGVLGGLEAIRALKRAHFQPRHAIELVLFTSEEPTRFGIGCLGSRLLSGTLSPETARQLTDKDGETLEQVRRKAGYAGQLDEVRLPPGFYKAFVELHIEQGPMLERERVGLGIVTKIAAPASARILVEGMGGHAGGLLMQDRHDALCAAAELILSIERGATSSPSVDSVATVGICEVFPGAVNSVPSLVRLSLDARDTDLERRDQAMRAIETAAQQISKTRGVSIQIDMVNADAPAECAPEVMAALRSSCRTHGQHFLMMVSRAYHDSLFMSRLAPVGMLFIPCRHGYSHRPDEFASIDDIARGTLVLAETLASLSA